MNCIERYEAEGTASKISAFRIKQQLPYEQKVILAERRAKEYYRDAGRTSMFRWAVWTALLCLSF